MDISVLDNRAEMSRKFWNTIMTSSLARVYQITPEPLGAPRFEKFIFELDATLDSGIKLVQLRAKNLNRHDHLAVAELALAICRKHGALLIFNGSIDMALEARCDGVHLSSEALMKHQERPVLEGFLFSAACHTKEEISQAERISADFIVLSPVFATKSHPEAIPMGWPRFTELVAGARIPVFALGGMSPEMLEEAKKHRAWGIAAISSTWRGGSSKK